MLHPRYDVVVMIEDDAAKILRIGETDHRVEAVVEARAQEADPHARRHRGDGANAARAYFDAIAETLLDARRLLVVGTNEPKLSFVAHLQREHPTIFDRVLGVEAIARLSESDLAAFARAQFAAA